VSIIITRGIEANLDSLSSGKDEGVFSHIEVSCISSTINDFFESWDFRWEVRDSVNVPLSCASSLKRRESHYRKIMTGAGTYDDQIEIERNIGIANFGRDKRTEVSLT